MRAVLVALLLVSVAGCSAPKEDPAPPETGPGTITAPGEMLNDTSAHFHDYWHGGQRLTVVDASHPGGDAQGTGPGVAGGDDVVVRSFQPASQDVIPQGTAFLEVTFTWEDADLDSYRDPVLWMRSAAQDAPVEAGPVANGETLNVSVGEDDADLPHQILSAWLFELRMSSPDPMPLRFKGAVELKVDAIRGRPLPLFPAHPDPWQGRDEMPLLDVTGELSYFEDVRDSGCNGQACPTTHLPPAGALVPHNASVVRVGLVWTSPAAPLRLLYHSGLSRDFEVAVPEDAANGVATYEIGVLGGGDGPYAKQSQWEFRVEPQPTGPLTTAWFAEYSLTAVVERVPL